MIDPAAAAMAFFAFESAWKQQHDTDARVAPFSRIMNGCVLVPFVSRNPHLVAVSVNENVPESPEFTIFVNVQSVICKFVFACDITIPDPNSENVVRSIVNCVT
jgi:hypothetical protein